MCRLPKRIRRIPPSCDLRYLATPGSCPIRMQGRTVTSKKTAGIPKTVAAIISARHACTYPGRWKKNYHCGSLPGSPFLRRKNGQPTSSLHHLLTMYCTQRHASNSKRASFTTHKQCVCARVHAPMCTVLILACRRTGTVSVSLHCYPTKNNFADVSFAPKVARYSKLL